MPEHWPITDTAGNPAGWEDCLHGAPVFLVLSGPSLRSLPLEELNQRGIVTFGVNNAATCVRCNFWTFGDRPMKFHDSIWADPAVVKLVPLPKVNKRKEQNEIRTKRPDGTLVSTGKIPGEWPNVWGVQRNSTFNVKDWLWEDTVNWGNGNTASQDNGLPRVLNTMFQAVRLCYYLGFRTVYLLGCDFSMDENDRYAFKEKPHAGSARQNRGHYEKLNYYFRQLRPWFDDARFTVLNCNPSSRLEAFEKVDFRDAIMEATKAVPKVIDTEGWYHIS